MRNRKIEYITDEAARKATFKKRKKGLLKKVNELSTMCGVDACAVISNPYEAALDVYPSHPEAQRVLARFRCLPEMNQRKKMVNQEGFIQQRIAKATEQLQRLKKKNREKELTSLMLQGLAIAGTHGDGGGNATVLDGMNLNDINELRKLVDQNLIDVEQQLKKVQAGKMKRGVDDNNDTEYALQPQPRERALMHHRPVAWHAGEASGEGCHAPPTELFSWHGGGASGEGWHAAQLETRSFCSPSEGPRQLPPTTEYGPYTPQQPIDWELVLSPRPPTPFSWDAGEASGEGWHAAPPEARGFWSASNGPGQLPSTTEYGPYAPPQPHERALVLSPPPPQPQQFAWNAGEASGEGWHGAPPEVRGFWSASDMPRQLPPTLTAQQAPEMAAMKQPPYCAQSAPGWGGTPKQQ